MAYHAAVVARARRGEGWEHWFDVKFENSDGKAHARRGKGLFTVLCAPSEEGAVWRRYSVRLSYRTANARIPCGATAPASSLQ